MERKSTIKAKQQHSRGPGLKDGRFSCDEVVIQFKVSGRTPFVCLSNKNYEFTDNK